MMALKIYRRVLEADKGPGGTELRTSADVCWLSCVFYTTAYVEDIRVTPGSAEHITHPEPGRDYSEIVRPEFQAMYGGGGARPAAAAPAEVPADATLEQE